MKVTWRRTETREVRPFYSMATLATLLDQTKIDLFGNGSFQAEESFTLSDIDVGRVAPRIRTNVPANVLSRLPADEVASLELIAWAANPFLKRSQRLVRVPLQDGIPDEVEVPPFVVSTLGGGGNLVLEVGLCLARDVAPRPGRPFRRGHWISHKRFVIRAARLDEDFEVQTLDDEGWRARGLPPKTLYFVDYLGPINEASKPDQPVAKVSIHLDAYNKMAVDGVGKGGKAIQAFLAVESICQMLSASVKEWETAAGPEPKSPLAGLLKRINKSRVCTLAELRALASDPGTQRLRAILQADLELVKMVVEG